MNRENDITPKNACEIEKNIGVIRICNPNHFKEWKPKNACKVGITTTKKAYIVTLENDEEGKEILKVHTIRRNENDVMEILEGNTAKLFFSKLMFY